MSTWWCTGCGMKFDHAQECYAHREVCVKAYARRRAARRMAHEAGVSEVITDIAATDRLNGVSPAQRHEWTLRDDPQHGGEVPPSAPVARLPTDPAERKAIPLVSGLLDYFPDALMAVAHVSYVANEQHNPGEPMHWARGKSTDEADCAARHLVDRGTIDTDGLRHSAKATWRMLSMLQKEIEEAENKPISRGSTPE